MHFFEEFTHKIRFKLYFNDHIFIRRFLDAVGGRSRTVGRQHKLG